MPASLLPFLYLFGHEKETDAVGCACKVGVPVAGPCLCGRISPD